MADLNQFIRSKDKLAEMHSYLMATQNTDEQTHSHIRTIELSIKTLDQKIKELGLEISD